MTRLFSKTDAQLFAEKIGLREGDIFRGDRIVKFALTTTHNGKPAVTVFTSRGSSYTVAPKSA